MSKKTDLFTIQDLDNAVAFAVENVYLSELKRVTPKDTGYTASRWKIRKESTLNYQLVNDSRSGDYLIVLLLEYGTRPHVIRPKNAKALHWQKGSKDIFATKVNHPGFEGRRFIEGVMNDESLIERFEKVMMAHIERNVRFA